ncbi:matrixin family metalloprotease [Ruania suaedae]|uniref:matrixin family metalloprotease n=1 Tax=Ruania suaedae TaxID=2897774 RepID=UPI00338F6A0B
MRRALWAILSTVALAVGLLAVGSPPASAWTSNGCTWESTTIRYNISSGSWATAVAQWNAAAVPTYFDYSTSSARVGLGTANNSSVSWDGLTGLTCSGGTTTYATAVINGAYTDSYSNYKLRSVTAHELGHVLGLDETSGCRLMHPTTEVRYSSCGISSPGSDEVNGINALY